MGSQRDVVGKLIARGKAQPGPEIVAERTADGGRMLGVGAGKGSGSVWLVALKSETIVRIGSGENGGRAIRYTNVLLSEQAVGRWDGSAATLSIPGKAFLTKGADRYAILIKSGSAGRILAARYI